MASYDAIINLRLKGLDQLKEVDRAITNITGGGRAGRGRGRETRQQLTAERQLTGELLKRQKALQALNRIKDGTDPVSKSIRRNQQLQEKRRRLNLSENVSSRFLRGQKSEAATNIRVELKRRGKEEEALQRRLQQMNQKSLHINKATRMERKRSLSLGNDIVRQKTKEVELEVKARATRLKGGPTGFKAFQYGPREPGIFQSAQGDFTRLSDRQSRNVQGKRTFMNNRFARMGVPMPTKGFDTQSALISGAFPLLFGQGPVGAAAGALGGGIGGMFGSMGGFAGGIAATALVQQVQQLISSLGNLGKAMGPFVQDTNALVNSMGLAGTAEEARIKIIEQLEGKQAAFNAAMQKMRETIGTKATKRLEEFGKTSQLIGSEFKIAMTKMQASLIPVINLVDKLLGLSKGAREAQQKRFIETSTDTNIVSRREEIERLQNTTGGGRSAQKRRSDRIKVLEQELKLRAQVGIIEQEAQTRADQLTLEFAQHVKKTQEKFKLEKEVEKLMKGGMNQAVAEQIAQNNVLAEQARKRLEVELAILKAKIADPDTENVYQLGVEYNKIKKTLEDLGVEQDKINKLTDEYGKKTEKIKITREEIVDLLATETTNAIMGLIDGTKTLSESLAGVAKQLASMFLNRAFSAMFGGLFSEQGSYSRAGGFKAFQYGGVVNGPTLGMVGEGGEPEYIIPASKMDGAMQRYSSGARGGAVIPGGSHAAGTVAGASGNTVVEYTGPTLNFNGDNYVPRDAIPKIISTAAQQGASMGQSKMMNTLKNSRSQRSKLGI